MRAYRCVICQLSIIFILRYICIWLRPLWGMMQISVQFFNYIKFYLNCTLIWICQVKQSVNLQRNNWHFFGFKVIFKSNWENKLKINWRWKWLLVVLSGYFIHERVFYLIFHKMYCITIYITIKILNYKHQDESILWILPTPKWEMLQYYKLFNQTVTLIVIWK